MSMLAVAKCLYFSRSIDLSHEEDRYFNLSLVHSGHLFACMNAKRGRNNWSPSCVRMAKETIPQFLKGK